MRSWIGTVFKGMLVLLLAGNAFTTVSAVAQEIGAAAAVNPLSEGTPPAGGTRVLRIGARIVHNERIRTTSTGTVQILFIDKTTLNIGPNSDLVIDKFVYNPADGTGEMVTTLAKGVLRFVGGILSHRGAATVNTPVSAIGVRGGIATIMQSKNGARAINHFGQLSSTNGCGTVIIRRAGFAISIPDWNSCPTAPERVSQSEVNRYLALLTSKPGQTGGAHLLPTEALVGQFGVGQLYGPFGPDTEFIQQQTTNVENIVFDIIIQAT